MTYMHVLCTYIHIQVIKYDNVINNCEPVYTIQEFKHGHNLLKFIFPHLSVVFLLSSTRGTQYLESYISLSSLFLQFKHMFLGMPKYWILQFSLFLNITLNVSLWTSSYGIYSFFPLYHITKVHCLQLQFSRVYFTE